MGQRGGQIRELKVAQDLHDVKHFKGYRLMNPRLYPHIGLLIPRMVRLDLDTGSAKMLQPTVDNGSCPTQFFAVNYKERIYALYRKGST